MITKRLLLLCLLLSSVIGVSWAQQTSNTTDSQSAEAETTETVPEAIVTVESAFVRIAPSQEAEAVASVFEEDRLEVVSRNLDGTWFEVRRPRRMASLGWIFNEMIEGEFLPEQLPLGDNETGVTGPNPLTGYPEIGVFLIEGPALRDNPTLTSNRIMNIPPLITIPATARNQNGSWLYVNYLGTQGWIIGFTARRNPRIMELPQPPGLPPLQTIEVVVIPPEVQRAQINRLREYIYPRSEMAKNLENFWWSVFRGEVMPCDPPPAVANYPYTEQDVRELPELQRVTPRLRTGIEYLNAAIRPLNDCGVVAPDDVYDARDSAINARIILEATLDRLDLFEESIRG